MIDYCDDSRYAERAHLLGGSLAARRSKSLGDDLQMLGQLLQTSLKEEIYLLHSSWGHLIYPGLLLALIVGFLPKKRRPYVILMGDMWEPHRGLRNLVERLIVKLADRGIALYIVLSDDDLDLLPDTWGVARTKIRCCPFFYTMIDQDIVDDVLPGTHIFAGGNSHREYEVLLDVARQMPEQAFILATSCLKKHKDIPRNVRAGLVPHHEFMTLLQSAAVVAMPLRRRLRRSVGQQTYLNAMWLGKPLVITETAGVHDYIQHGKTGFIVDGSPTSYVKTLRHIIDPANQEEVSTIVKAAQKVVREQFTFEKHVSALLAIIDEGSSA